MLTGKRHGVPFMCRSTRGMKEESKQVLLVLGIHIQIHNEFSLPLQQTKLLIRLR